jgi:hypothetical protein
LKKSQIVGMRPTLDHVCADGIVGRTTPAADGIPYEKGE